MSDVFMSHPDLPGRTIQVTKKQFAIWSESGWVDAGIEDISETVEDSQDLPILDYDDADPVLEE